MRSSFVFDIYSFDKNTGADGKKRLLHVSVVPVLRDVDAGLARLKELKENYLISISMPFVSRGTVLKKFKENFSRLATAADGFTLQNFGDYAILTDLFNENGLNRDDFSLHGDYSLNVMNSEAAAFWVGKLDSAAILPELSLKNQLALAKKFPAGLTPEIIGSKNVIVMRSEHCFGVKGENFHCGNCGKYGLCAGKIKDEYGKSFSLICNPFDCTCVMVADDFPLENEAFNPPENMIFREI